jgi:membrane protein
LGSGAPGSAYGAAGSLITMLIWIYYAAQIVLFGVEFTRVYAQERGRAFVRQGMRCASIAGTSESDEH